MRKRLMWASLAIALATPAMAHADVKLHRATTSRSAMKLVFTTDRTLKKGQRYVVYVAIVKHAKGCDSAGRPRYSTQASKGKRVVITYKSTSHWCSGTAFYAVDIESPGARDRNLDTVKISVPAIASFDSSK